MNFRNLKAASFIQCHPVPRLTPPLEDLGTNINTEIKKSSFYHSSESAHQEHHPDWCWVVVVFFQFTFAQETKLLFYFLFQGFELVSLNPEIRK